MIMHSVLSALVIVMMQVAALAQSTDPAPRGQNAQSGNATGVIDARDPGTQSLESVRMTQSERFRFYLKRTYGIASVFESAAGAGIEQWYNTPKEWKQGGEAYGDRFGNSYAIHVIAGTLEYGASAALREDNRYFRSRDTGFWRRFKHVIGNTFIARNDAGQEHFAYSRFGSAAGAAFVSRIWQPHSTNSAGDGVEVFGIAIGADFGRNMFNEFWPDVKHHVLKRE